MCQVFYFQILDGVICFNCSNKTYIFPFKGKWEEVIDGTFNFISTKKDVLTALLYAIKRGFLKY